MRILETCEMKLEPTDLNKMRYHLPPSEYDMLPGHVGVATILKYIAVQRNMFTVDDEQDEVPLEMLMGMGWEMACAQLYPDLNWQPGVYGMDLVQGHPDGLSTNVLGFKYCNEEWKWTTKSLRKRGGKEDDLKDVLQEWLWMEQQKAYCALWSYHLGEPVLHSRLHVCWSRGVYMWPHKPRYFRYLIEFTESELRATWGMLVEHREAVLCHS